MKYGGVFGREVRAGMLVDSVVKMLKGECGGNEGDEARCCESGDISEARGVEVCCNEM